MVLWLLRLRGRFCLPSGLDSPHVRLTGASAVCIAAATLAFFAQHPFPRA